MANEMVAMMVVETVVKTAAKKGELLVAPMEVWLGKPLAA